jgi:perosamine synthetase
MVRHENRFVNLGVEDFASIARALEGLELSGSAKIVGEYERAVAAKFGSKECVGVNSGTVSIYTALMALGIGPGDEVIVAPTAPIMSALPIIHLGAVPVYADVSVEPSFGFDPVALESSVTGRTKAILCVPMWGYPIDMDVVMAVAARHNLPVVEDVAQSHGTTWHGKYLGTFGAIGCFSTHERKLITTGEGAFLLTDNSVLAEQMRVLSRYGIKNGLGGHVFGSNFKLGAIPAALGISQLKKLDKKIALRKKVADRLRARLSTLGWLKEFLVTPGCVHNGYSLVFLITDPSIDVEKLGQTMESRGVVSDSWRYKYQPMYKLPLFQAYAKTCPNAEAQIPRTITLPCHEGLSDEDIAYIADVVATSAI